MMRFIDSILIPACFGMALAIIGYTFLNWQFWIVFILASVWRWSGREVEKK